MSTCLLTAGSLLKSAGGLAAKANKSTLLLTCSYSIFSIVKILDPSSGSVFGIPIQFIQVPLKTDSFLTEDQKTVGPVGGALIAHQAKPCLIKGPTFLGILSLKSVLQADPNIHKTKFSSSKFFKAIFRVHYLLIGEAICGG